MQTSNCCWTRAASHCCYRFWTKRRTIASECYRLPLGLWECGSSRWGRWRPSTIHSTSATLMSPKSVWLPKCGVRCQTSTRSSLLCAEERWDFCFSVLQKCSNIKTVKRGTFLFSKLISISLAMLIFCSFCPLTRNFSFNLDSVSENNYWWQKWGYNRGITHNRTITRERTVSSGITSGVIVLSGSCCSEKQKTQSKLAPDGQHTLWVSMRMGGCVMPLAGMQSIQMSVAWCWNQRVHEDTLTRCCEGSYSLKNYIK